MHVCDVFSLLFLALSFSAPGYAYGLKQVGSDNCVIVYFGDGAAQEGDAHAAMSFASTLKCPVIFFWSLHLPSLSILRPCIEAIHSIMYTVLSF